MRPKHDHYLHFTKKERNGIVVLMVLIILLIIIPFFYQFLFREKTTAGKYDADIAQLKIRNTDTAKRYFDSYKQEKSNRSGYHSSASPELFLFDPNTLSAEGWIRLGVKDKTIKTIQNYLSKGGVFREAEDIKKIWGLQYMADRLLPYVRISNVSHSKDTDQFYQKEYTKKSYRYVDINQGDSNSFAILPGIGARLSQRIYNYREKLGGFYSADQVAETFGLPDSTYQRIRPFLNTENGSVQQININSATLEELKAHPYIRYHLANAIVQYRQQHGNYASVTTIRNIMLVNDSIYKKASPYLSVE